MGPIAVLAPLILAASSSADASCNPIPGWDAVLADQKRRFIVMGEIHGTNEMPAAFANAVCATAQTRRVVVAVEQPSSDQAAIDAYISSDGGRKARRAFLSASAWSNPFKDGRSSQAYFRLFETLRRWRSSGRITAVVAFQQTNFSGPFDPANYEVAMAEILRSTSRPGTTTIALVGNVHAKRQKVSWPPQYMPMAGNLPEDETISLNMVGEAGSAWICTGRGASACSAQAWGRNTGHARGVELTTEAQGDYSGTLFLGVPITASPPQVGAKPARNRKHQ